MDNKMSPLAINELRESLPKTEKKIFKKSLLGGYDLKEVQDHIKFMNDQLKQAETSYINQLDEYNAAAAMLSQERDRLREQLNQTQAVKDELEKKANLLYMENRELMRKSRELESRAAKAEEYMAQSDAQRIEIDMLKKQCANYLESNEQIQAELLRAKEGKEHLRSGAGKLENQEAPNEYDQVKKQYDEVIKEKNNAIAEKQVALEKCKTISANLDEMYARNLELWNENSRLKLKTRKIISAYETNAHEISHKHMKNTDEIRVYINTILDLLDSEGADIAKMIHVTYDEIEHEDEGFQNNKE
jgi:chromosome segregation ATPase